jgi:holo-ACP synthase
MNTAARTVSLDEILLARDRRAEKQRQIIREYSVPLISFMINMPGPVKNLPLSVEIFRAGLTALEGVFFENKLVSRYREVHYYHTGAEAFIAVDYNETDLKKMMTFIEETHPLGRLFDLDVIGLGMNLISREMLGVSKRKCLLCEDDARVCGRSRKHPSIELVNKIRSLAEDYFRG